MRIFLKVPGIDGDSAAPSFEKQIRVTSFRWEAAVPIDAATGLPSGSVRPKRIAIVKRWDLASALLANAAFTHNVLTPLLFSFVQESISTVIMRLEVQNAIITSIAGTGTGGAFVPTEEIGIDYQKLVFTYANVGTTSLTAGSSA